MSEHTETATTDNDEDFVQGACAACGHDPSCGFASVVDGGVEFWLCHDDDHSCYMGPWDPPADIDSSEGER